MSTAQFSSSKASIPDFEVVAQSIKAIKQSVLASKDGAYSYYADKFKLASAVANNLDKQIAKALISLPISLDNMKAVLKLLEAIGKIDAGERAGKIPTEKAAVARGQMQANLGNTVSSIIKDFNEVTAKLSEPADRLSNYARTIKVRLQETIATETSNQERAKRDVERESARLKTLEERYEKLKTATDEARGGPTDDLVGLVPDKNELLSLLDDETKDAATPKVVGAKKSIEIAIEQIKEIFELFEKTNKFTELAEVRDEIYSAVKAQRTVTEAAQERLRTENKALKEVDTYNTTVESMNSLAAETKKLVNAFSSFATKLQDMEGKQITADTLVRSFDDMEFYLEKARDAHNNVIV